MGFAAGKYFKRTRRFFLENLGINYRDLVTAGQVHGKRVVLVDQRHRGKGALSKASRLEEVDGFITAEKNLPLAVFTADCLSIFLFDPKKRIVGLVHAGWQGTYQKIASAAVKLMQQRFKTQPKDLLVGLGPAIRKCCYEVGENFQRFFSLGIIKRREKTYLDLIANNKEQLINSGVKKKNIIDCEICTACQNEKFFSYRREGEKAGRMMSVIMLKGDG